MQHTFATLLSWLATYLIHSTLLLCGALLVARAIRGPAVREVLWKGALLGGLVTATLHGTLGAGLGVGRFDLPLVSGAGQPTLALQVGTEGPGTAAVTYPGPRTPAEAAPGVALTRSVPRSGAAKATPPARWPGLIAAAWALGALVLLAVFLHERRRMSRLFATRRPVRDRAPRAALAQLLTQARSSRRVRLTSCPGIGSPVALGTSEICLPERAGRDLSMGELEALMAHELAHLERRDSLWLTTIHLLERVLFPQPLNRIVRRRLQSDVEVLCDDSAARRLGQPAELARCLARVAGWMESSPTPALATGMAHSPSQLVARVERLLAPRSEPRRGAGVLAALGVGLVLTAVGFGGPGVAPPARQDTPAEARLLRVVASMRTVAKHPAVNYRLGEFETTELENLGRHLALLHGRYPEARIAIATHVGAESLTGLVDGIFERFDAILVEGEGPEQDALRMQIVHQRPVKVRLEVIDSGRKVDPETGKPWSGEGRYTFDDTRLVEYRLGDLGTRTPTDLRGALLREHTRRPQARVRLDAGPGTVQDDVMVALDLVIEAGFTDVGFVGFGLESPIYAAFDPVQELFEEIEEVEPEEIIEEVEPDHPTDIGPEFAGPGLEQIEQIEEIEEEPVLLDEEIEEVEPDSDWSTLDQEIARLTESLSLGGGGALRLDPFDPVVLDIDAAGRIYFNGKIFHDPLRSGETWSELRAWLARVAAGMEKVPAKTGPKGLLLPDEPLLISADSATTFQHVQKIMEFCGAHDVQIWKIELAAPNAGLDQVPIWLPTDTGVVGEQSPILSVKVRVLDIGTNRQRLEYSVGSWKTTELGSLRTALARQRVRRSDLRLVIDPRNGTTVIEILRLLRMVRAEGYGPISFVGAYPESVR